MAKKQNRSGHNPQHSGGSPVTPPASHPQSHPQGSPGAGTAVQKKSDQPVSGFELVAIPHLTQIQKPGYQGLEWDI